MRNIYKFLIFCLAFNLQTIAKPSSNSVDCDKLELIIEQEGEIEFRVSREDLTSKLIDIWNYKYISIAKGHINFNGEITTQISVFIDITEKLSKIQRDVKIKKTVEKLKNGILNIKDYDEIKILYSFQTEDSERVTSSKVYKAN